MKRQRTKQVLTAPRHVNKRAIETLKKLVWVRVGKTDHQAWLQEEIGEAPTVLVRWMTGKEEKVPILSVREQVLAGRRSRSKRSDPSVYSTVEPKRQKTQRKTKTPTQKRTLHKISNADVSMAPFLENFSSDLSKDQTGKPEIDQVASSLSKADDGRKVPSLRPEGVATDLNIPLSRKEVKLVDVKPMNKKDRLKDIQVEDRGLFQSPVGKRRDNDPNAKNHCNASNQEEWLQEEQRHQQKHLKHQQKKMQKC